MRTLLLLLALSLRLMAGEIIVVAPSGDLAAPVVESLADGESLKVPKPILTQENQLASYTFKNIKPGRYRVSYLACDNPLGCNETLMETLVNLGESTTETVFLFRPQEQQQLMLPKEVEEFLSQHHDNFLEVAVVYDGSKTSFMQARGGAWAIRYLRHDCEYHLKVWNHSFRHFPKNPKDRTVIFDQKFRTVARHLDPFAPGGIPKAQKRQSEQGGSGQPATRSESK
jgi:hypothetical protein